MYAIRSYYVGLLQQRVQIYIAPDGPPCVVLICVKRQHAHAERFCDLARALPDAAKADDAHGPAFQLDQRIIPEAPVNVAAPSARVHGVARITSYNVCYTKLLRTYGTAAVGQFAIAMLLEICHHVAHHSDAVHAGRWSSNIDWSYNFV